MGCGGTKVYDLHDLYDIGEKLGAGAFGQVRVATHKKTGLVRAVKVIWKEEQGVTIEELMEEIYVMRLMDHPLIVHLYDFFEDDHFLYTVIDSYTGGELFQKLSSSNLVKEYDAARYIRMMIDACQYLQTVSVVHRDIKPENFLFQDKTPESNLCMIDFGLSQRVTGDEWLSVCCGTVQYLSPEQIKGRYRFTGDMWAVGVIGYLLIYGKFPFSGSSDSRIMYEIMSVEPNFKSSKHKEGSMKEAGTFLRRMLVKDPQKRITPEEALQQKWLNSKEEDISGVIDGQTIENAKQEWQMSRREVSSSVEDQRDQQMKAVKSDNARKKSVLGAPRASLLIPGASGPHGAMMKGTTKGSSRQQGAAYGGPGTLGILPEDPSNAGHQAKGAKRPSILAGFMKGPQQKIAPTFNPPPVPKNLHRDEGLEKLALIWRKSNSVSGDEMLKQVKQLEERNSNLSSANVHINDEGKSRPRTMSIQALPSEQTQAMLRKGETKDLAKQFRPNAILENKEVNSSSSFNKPQPLHNSTTTSTPTSDSRTPTTPSGAKDVN